MTSVSLEMSASAQSRAETSHPKLDESLAVLRDHAREFARLSASQRAALLRECIPRILQVGQAWVEAAAKAKGLPMDEPVVSEEWLAGPMPTIRNTRLLARSLDQIAREGKPQLSSKRFGRSRDGRTLVRVFPGEPLDAALSVGFTADVRMEQGMDERDVRARQASFYDQRDPEGGVSLVLGAGNVASIPPMDALYKMFVEGKVCLIKLNPVNEYLGPFYENAFKPLFDRGYLRLAYGGAEVGSYLTMHPSVDDVHITGSDRTHDLIVWGPPGPERERRKAANDPVLKKPISSELGCVTPVVIVPAQFSQSELHFLAENVATMVANNASCNCNAGKMLVTSKHWPQREDFLRRLREVLGAVPSRKAYYPGAHDRYEHLVGGREGVVKLGSGEEGRLPWTLVFGLDAASENERLFTTEPFCPILSETTLQERDPSDFLDAATRFCNDKLWGTLSAVLIVHPKLERDPVFASTLDRAIAELRYGAVGINQWTGIVYGLVTPPWGAHPSSTLQNIQGGLGWVHNTFMLEGIEKVVLRGPLVVSPKPPWFVTNRSAHRIAPKLVDLEAAPSWFKLPGVVFHAIRG